MAAHDLRPSNAAHSVHFGARGAAAGHAVAYAAATTSGIATHPIHALPRHTGTGCITCVARAKPFAKHVDATALVRVTGSPAEEHILRRCEGRAEPCPNIELQSDRFKGGLPSRPGLFEGKDATVLGPARSPDEQRVA